MLNSASYPTDYNKDINLIFASIEDIKNMEVWLLDDEKISRYATDSFIGDYKYYYNNPIDEISGYQYKINENVWLLKAEIENIIIGYIILFFDKNISTTLSINPIVVNPKMQGKGIGKSIVKKIIDMVKDNVNIETIGAGCISDNEVAIKMFKKLNFIENNALSTDRFYQLIYKL